MDGAREQYVHVNGVRLFVQTVGEGEPLLLLMGLGAPGDKWERNVRAYRRHFRCILIDNRGAGRSDKPEAESYSVADMAGDAVGVLDALGVESAHVNGISMGGAIAQELAIRWPERVRSLILTSTFCTVTDTFRFAISFLRDQTGTLEPAVKKRLNQWMTFSQKTQNERPEFLREMADEDAAYPWPMPAFAYRAQCGACLSHESTDRLGRIKAPTLIAAGGQDLFAGPAVARLMHERIPGSALYFCPEGGHVHEWEYLDEYNRVTTDFLLSHRTEARPDGLSLGGMTLSVRDVSASVRFYREVLGLPVREELPDRAAVIPGDGQELVLLAYRGGDDALVTTGIGVYPAGFHHLCLEAPEIEALYEKVRASGWPLERELLRGADNNLQFWVRDPDGYPVELMRMTEESLQATCR